MAIASRKSSDSRLRVDRPDTQAEGLSDEELLGLFLKEDGIESQEAFRSLIHRHGPMVMGVCRHVLHQHQDAEDAFQATFLALARKAGTIRNQRVLAGWLYGVAYRIAIRARANSSRRRDHERQGVAMSAATIKPDHENEAAWNELRPVLHDEVNQLPEKYRQPVILSYLEGKSNEEVARLLNWPVGTVKGRLSRARDLLRSRLTRKGLVLSGAFLCTALSRSDVFAETVPDRLIESTASAAIRARSVAGALGESVDCDTHLSKIDILAETESPSEFALQGKATSASMGLAMMLLISAVSLGFAITSVLNSNPLIITGLRNAMWSFSHGQWPHGCH
jgi:RNA polymerase sigma-70 factor (ECF subfamily)